VHNRTKRLPPVAIAFKEFLVREGAALIERLVQFGFGSWPGGKGAHAKLPDSAAPARAARRRAARQV